MLASVEGEQGGAWAGRLLLALNGGEGSEVAGGVGEKEVEGREREVLLVAVDWREGKALGWSSCLLCLAWEREEELLVCISVENKEQGKGSSCCVCMNMQ